MSAPSLTESATVHTPGVAAKPPRRCPVIIEEKACIPGWVVDLESFRRWAYSEEFPERGWFSYLNGEIWADVSMEEFLFHNQVKSAFTFRILWLLELTPSGRFVPDRMLLTNTTANLSTEPDGLFFFWDTLKSGRLRLVEGAAAGYMELDGTPDMVLEIVSRTSVKKDTKQLLELYWRAGISEYWLVDVRGESIRFDVFRYAQNGYVVTEPQDGWLFSKVFGQAFRLTRYSDPLGYPQFKLEARVIEQAAANA